MYQDMFPNTAALDIKKLLNKCPQCVYAGFDPTADSLHVGNLLVIINLLHWQRGGHNVIALLGGATGYIGDPSGRSSDRIAISSDVIANNVHSIRSNLETVFENHKKYVCSEGEDKLKPIGGSDQMGNISAGHELISRTVKKDVYGLTLPLVTTEEGDKFGKSAGNALWLDAKKTSPYSLYQYFIRTKDSDVERLLKLFTFYSLGEIKDIMFKHKQHPEERYPQMCLAEQLTTLVHGEEGLAKARQATGAIYSKDVKSLISLSSTDLEQVFEGAPVVNLLLSPGITVLKLGMLAKCFPTENDAMRIIEAGGFYINHQRIKNINEVVTESAHILPNLISLLRVGKRNYYIIKWQT
ncbi:unnamed protein product, partial [Iphiclides podalirius]